MEQKSSSHILPPKDANALSARQQNTELAYLLDKFSNKSKVSESWYQHGTRKKKSMKTLPSLTRNEFHSNCTSAGPTAWTSTAANCCCFILFFTSSNLSQESKHKYLQDHQITKNSSPQHK